MRNGFLLRRRLLILLREFFCLVFLISVGIWREGAVAPPSALEYQRRQYRLLSLFLLSSLGHAFE